MDLDWLKKKKLTRSVNGRRALVEPTHPNLRMERQGDLVGLARSSDY